MEKLKIKLYGDAFFASGMSRLPDENGVDTEFFMEDEWLQAHAFSDDGKEFLVLWDLLPDWDGLDSDHACDWEHPRAVLGYLEDGSPYDASAKVVITE